MSVVPCSVRRCVVDTLSLSLSSCSFYGIPCAGSDQTCVAACQAAVNAVAYLPRAVRATAKDARRQLVTSEDTLVG